MLNRRDLVKGAVMVPLAAQELWPQRAAAGEKRRCLLIGTQTETGSSKGIYAGDWDPGTGEIRDVVLAAESDNPTFLALSPDGKYLYAANEISSFAGRPSGAVSGFAVEATARKLRLINQVAAMGMGTCYVSVDHAGRAAFCANYTGGSASSFYLSPDGQISDAVSHFQYEGHGPNPDRQEKPHAHRVTPSPDDRYLLVNDLGLDCIHIYHLNDANARLTPNNPPQWTAKPGSGPRALRFHPNGRVAYCVCEMASTVDVLDWDAQQGTLRQIQTVSLIPDDYRGPTRGCDIVLDRKARFAYAANRDYDCLVSFSVAKDGKLALMGRSSCGGKIPRHLTLDPTERWLLVANQDSDNIAVFARDEETGKLAETGKSFSQSKPQCLVFA
jgi:6-phosphogluconolactonase